MWIVVGRGGGFFFFFPFFLPPSWGSGSGGEREEGEGAREARKERKERERGFEKEKRKEEASKEEQKRKKKAPLVGCEPRDQRKKRGKKTIDVDGGCGARGESERNALPARILSLFLTALRRSARVLMTHSRPLR